MQVLTNDWNEITLILKSVVTDFNESAFRLTAKDVSDIETITHAQLIKLIAIKESLKEREERLSNQRCMSTTHTVAHIASCVLFIIGIVLSHSERKLLTDIGLPFEACGLMCETFAWTYSHNKDFHKDELIKLARFNTTEIENAKLLKIFLNRFKKIKLREEKIISLFEQIKARIPEPIEFKNDSSPEKESIPLETTIYVNEVLDNSPKMQAAVLETIPRNLTNLTNLESDDEDEDEDEDGIENIKSCIQVYKSLPEEYKKDETLSLITSTAINSLPRDHLLKQELSDLENSAMLLQGSPKSSKEPSPARDYGVGDPLDPVVLQGEAVAQTQAYHDKWSNYAKQLKRTFKVTNLPFLITSAKIRLTAEGVILQPHTQQNEMKVDSSQELEDSALTSAEI